MEIYNPADVGMDPARLDRLNQLMGSYVDSGRLAGTITALSRHGKLVHLQATGMADVEGGLPMKLDAIFRIYSMAKAITSVAAMILFERGHFQLTTPVSEFFPDFKGLRVFSAGTVEDYSTVKAEREMTVGDLLKHTSGLTYSFLESNVVDALYGRHKIDFMNPHGTESEAMMKRLAKQPLVYSPGTAWNYSVSTDVLGLVVEKISGMSLGAFMKKEIFEPLGMVDTAFFVHKEKMNRLAVCYGSHLAGGMMANFPGVPVGKKMIPISDHSLLLETVQPSIESGGGGLYSTISDYMKFLQMMLDKGRVGSHQILSPRTVDYMTMNHLPGTMRGFFPKNLLLMPQVQEGIASPGCGFGLGFAVRVDNVLAENLGSLGQYFWGGAASTAFFVDPKESLIYCLMTQLLPSSTYGIRMQATSAIYQSLVD